jgi:hypothetical protein
MRVIGMNDVAQAESFAYAYVVFVEIVNINRAGDGFDTARCKGQMVDQPGLGYATVGIRIGKPTAILRAGVAFQCFSSRQGSRFSDDTGVGQYDGSSVKKYRLSDRASGVGR